MAQISEGYILAKKLGNGSPGRPIGNDDGAVMMFDDLAAAKAVRDSLVEETPDLSIFRINVVIVGEVVL